MCACMSLSRVFWAPVYTITQPGLHTEAAERFPDIPNVYIRASFVVAVQAIIPSPPPLIRRRS